MNPWLALYVKELRENQGTFLFLLFGTLALDVYAYVRGVSNGFGGGSVALSLVPFVAAFVLPFVLLHSFAQEFRGQTHYQWLSLPVPRAAVVLTKYLAVLTAGVAVFVLATAGLHLISLAYTSVTHNNFSAITGGDMWLALGSFFFTSFFLLTGIATAMAGLKLVVRRFQKLAMAAFLVFSLYLYGRLLVPAFGVLGPVFGHHAGRADTVASVTSTANMIPVTLYTVVFSLLFVGLGIVLFERYAEA